MILSFDVKEMVGLLQAGQADASAPLGLCFGLNWVDGQRVFSYLVTSRHVVEDPLRGGYAICLRANASSNPAAEAIPLASHWVYHTDPAIDLAVLPRMGPAEAYPTTIAALSADSIVTPERLSAPLMEGIEVCAIGMLDPNREVSRSHLVVRQGHLALVTNAWLMGGYGPARYHVVECATHPDDSGAPVFMPAQSPTGQSALALLGLLTAPYPLQSPTYSNGSPRSGLALVTPGQFILEVLQQAELADLRRQGLGAGRIRQAYREPRLPAN